MSCVCEERGEVSHTEQPLRTGPCQTPKVQEQGFGKIQGQFRAPVWVDTREQVTLGMQSKRDQRFISYTKLRLKSLFFNDDIFLGYCDGKTYLLMAS